MRGWNLVVEGYYTQGPYQLECFPTPSPSENAGTNYEPTEIPVDDTICSKDDELEPKH